MPKYYCKYCEFRSIRKNRLDDHINKNHNKVDMDNNKVSCELMGGLGNQLFQIFTTISYALDYNKKFIFPDKKELKNGPTIRKTYWNNLLSKLKKYTESSINISKSHKESNFHFNNIPNYNQSIKLEGYFQSFKYFEKNTNKILDLIELDIYKKNIKDKYLKDDKLTISMHFRIDDYINLQDYHPILNLSYYINSLEYLIDKLDKDNFKVLYFCQDKDDKTVNEKINLLSIKFKNLIFEKVSNSLDDWEQLLLMSLSNHNIIANSSFSWWGSYLNTNQNKIVCCPDIWFGKKLKNYNTNDLFYNNCKIIKCSKEKVNGIILILSCEKYRYNRFEKYRLKKDNYENWKVIYVFGNLFLDKEYELNGSILTVRTEDSYLHLLKKLVLSIKYLYEIFDIKEGIMRSGDDLQFNENKLIAFLKSKNKDNFIGINVENKSENNPNIHKNYNLINDSFMVHYYKNHPSDFNNPQHNVKNINIKKYTRRPKLKKVIAGTLYYISNLSCKILVNHLKKINFNILHYDKLTKSYPYVIEDIGVSFILYLNKIKSTYNRSFVNQHEYRNLKDSKKDVDKFIAIHTQYLKNVDSINLIKKINVIKKCNVDELVKKYKNVKKDTLVVFGKGPSFKIVDKKDNQIFLCVNDSLNYINDCDFLVINDVKNMRKIKKDKLSRLKNLLIPYHIHIKLNPGSDITKQGPSLDYTYKNFIKEFKDSYKGNLIVFNLKSIDKNYSEFVSLKTAISSAHCGIEFLLGYLKNIKNVETYGMAGKNGYHKLFEHTVNRDHLNRCCSQIRANIFKDSLIKMTTNYNLKINN